MKKKYFKGQQCLIRYLTPPNIPNKCNGVLSVSSKVLIFTINEFLFPPEGSGLLIYIVDSVTEFPFETQNFQTSLLNATLSTVNRTYLINEYFQLFF